MNINDTTIELTDDLLIECDFNLSGTNTSALPTGLVINGDFDLRRTLVKLLPANLAVDGYLDIRDTDIKVIPDDLAVGILRADDRQLIASENMQINLIEKGRHMINIFKSPTEKATRFHNMKWQPHIDVMLC